ncbi:MAG: histidine phosphatase family protein [Dehalococcoidaceae bacterium]|nr:histidine phosphatase family protein [Dehalococcoidaceae bacterium]
MARIILVRHGETEWNKAMRVQGGGSDIALNDYGRSQAAMARRHLENEKLSAVYASPLCRAMETAHIIAEPHGLEITQVPELVEIDAGSYEGILTSELGRRFSQIVSELDENAELPCTPGGESLSMVQQRGWKALEQISAGHNGETVLVVTHYFVILAVICKVLNLPLVNVSRFWMATGSISIINLNGSIPRLETFNISP